MKIFITGASGKLGTALVKSFGTASELVLLDRTPTANSQSVTSYELDLSDLSSIDDIISRERPDVIIHLAAILGSSCESDPQLAEQINVEATRKLAEFASKYGVSKFVFASTSAIYRQSEFTPTNERSNIDPQSVYGQTKLKAEQAIQACAERSGTDFTVLRMFNIYGLAFSESLIYKLIHSTKDAPVTMFGPDNFYRDYIHVQDVVRAFEKAVALPHVGGQFRVMNIASGEATNNTSMVEQLVSQGIEPHYNTKDAGFSFTWADIKQAKEVLGFEPHTTIIVD
jgi:UDP-glucose 4-epimerase